MLGFFTDEVCCMQLNALDKEGAIDELIEVLVSTKKVKEADRAAIRALVLQREDLGSTGIGRGLAIPHVKACDKVTELVGAFGRAPNGIDFNAIDGEPCTLFFLLISPEGGSAEHLRVLQKIAGLGRNDRFVRFLTEAKDLAEVQSLLREVDEA